MSKITTERPNYACPRCQIGQCHPMSLTYTRMVGGSLISLPDMPAWMCDICGLPEYDEEALMHLEKLIGQSEGLDTARPNSKPLTGDLTTGETSDNNVQRLKP